MIYQLATMDGQHHCCKCHFLNKSKLDKHMIYSVTDAAVMTGASKAYHK